MEKTSKSEKIKSLLHFIQTYFAQLLFIPLLFGGIMQIIILFLISPQAIRFFSATQAVSDGLFFLTVVGLYILAIFFIILFSIFYGLAITDYSKAKWKYKKETETKTELTPYKFSHEAMPFYLHIILFLCSLLCYYILFIKHPENLNLAEFKISKIITFLGIAVALNFMLSINLMRFIYIGKEYYFIKNENVFLALNFSLCLVSVLIFSLFSSQQNILFQNFKNIEEKYCCENNGNVEILYFNDKYIFIKRKCDKENEQIIIEKFDALFEK